LIYSSLKQNLSFLSLNLHHLKSPIQTSKMNLINLNFFTLSIEFYHALLLLFLFELFLVDIFRFIISYYFKILYIFNRILHGNFSFYSLCYHFSLVKDSNFTVTLNYSSKALNKIDQKNLSF